MPVITQIQDPQDVANIALEAQKFFSGRDAKITRYRDLVRQVDWQQRQKTGKYAKFEGNESGTFFSMMVQLLSKNPVRHRLPYAKDNEQQRELKGAIERLVVSTYRDVDSQRGKRMESGRLETEISQYMCSDGWIVAEVVKNDDSDDKPLTDVRVHDNLNAWPQWGPDGLWCIVLKQSRSRLQVALEYPAINLAEKYQPRIGKYTGWGGDQSVDAYTCYYIKQDGKGGKEVYYCVTINGQWAIKPYVLEWAVGEIPVAVVPVNGLPYRSNRRIVSSFDPNNDTVNNANAARYRYSDWTTDVGRGIFFMNEELYPKFNELWAMVMDIVDTEARGTYWKKSEEGEDTDLVVGRGRDVVNPLRTDEEVGRVPPGGLSAEVVQALSGMAGMLQRGGISWQLMGQLPGQEFSGFAISQLISAALTIAKPYIEGLQVVYEQLDSFIIKAYQATTRKSQQIHVWREAKSFVEEEVDLGLLKDKKWYFAVEIKPGLPDDLASKINVARLAKEGRLLDDLTILDEVLGVEDPELIMERQLEMEVLSLPTVKLRRAAAQMVNQGNIEAAVAILQELMTLEGAQKLQQGQVMVQLQQLQQMLGQGQTANINMETGEGGAGPGGRAPEANPITAAARPTGGALPPETLPPEQAGVPPAAARAIMENMLGGMGRRVMV